MSVKLFLCILFSSPGHFLVNDLSTITKELAIRFQQNFTYILMSSVRIAVENSIGLMDDLERSISHTNGSTWKINQFPKITEVN